MKKVLCFALTGVVLLSLCTPAIAKEEESVMDEEIIVLRQEVTDTYEEMISVGEVLLYYFDDKTTRISASYNAESGAFDYVEYPIGSDLFSRTQKEIPKFLSPGELQNYIYLERGQATSVQSVNSVIIKTGKSVNTYSLSDSDLIKEKVLKVLCDPEDGKEPSEYTDINTRAVVVGATPVLISDSLVYNVKTLSSFWAAAKTAISVISAVLGLSDRTLKDIASFVLSVDGIFVLKHDADFINVEVTGARTRNCRINNTVYYRSWLNKTWTGYVAMGAALIYDSSVCDEYYDNDRKLAEFAYAAYEAGFIPVY